MLKVGVTGGIGSGKSLVCEVLEILGIPVYYADSRAKSLMNTDPDLRAAIIAAFGQEAYEGVQVNRPYLADSVFNHPAKLQLLNSLVHPAVWREMAIWFEQHEQFPYVVEESAILFETGLHKSLDKVILVYAPRALRISRTMERDNCSMEAVQERMRNQSDPEKTRELADFVIINDGISAVIPQVLHIHEQLLNL